MPKMPFAYRSIRLFKHNVLRDTRVKWCKCAAVGTVFFCCAAKYFSVNQQFMSRLVCFHSMQRLLFCNHYRILCAFPRRTQNAICHPAVTVTPYKDGPFVSDSMNPRQRCQATLNAAPFFKLFFPPSSRSPPAEC